MDVIRTIGQLRTKLDGLRAARRRAGKRGSVGFMPTLGYMHEGHASLIRRARAETDIVVVSIFVNPTQFGPNEDLSRYPRDEERDLAVARENGADVVFAPSVEEMYPHPPLTRISVAVVTERLCGASRPGHFDGVALVVNKLFHIVEPDFAYFGMKDAQQVAVLQTMAEDLNMRVKIVPCPTVRDTDGLALSSRNVYLSTEERRQALVLPEALERAEGWLRQFNGDPHKLRNRVKEHILTSPLAVVDYVEVLSYPSMKAPEEWEEGMRDRQMLLALAVKFGNTRLIDNRLLPISFANA